MTIRECQSSSHHLTSIEMAQRLTILRPEHRVSLTQGTLGTRYQTAKLKRFPHRLKLVI